MGRSFEFSYSPLNEKPKVNNLGLTQRELVLGELPNYLNRAENSWALLGDVRNYPKVSGDIDIAFHKQGLNEFSKSLREWSESHQLKLVQVFQHEVSSWFLIYIHISEEGFFFIHPDICTDFRRKNRLILTDEQLVGQRQIVSGSSHQYSWYEPDVSYQFIYYLVKRLEKKIIKEEHFEFFKTNFQEHSEKIIPAVNNFFGNDLGSEINEFFSKSTIEKNSGEKLLKQMGNKQLDFKVSFAVKLKVLYKNFCRLKNPTGLMISCPGHPEMLEAIIHRWKLAFRAVCHVKRDEPLPKNIFLLLRKSTLICTSNEHLPSGALLIDDHLTEYQIDQLITNVLVSRLENYLPSWLKV